MKYFVYIIIAIVAVAVIGGFFVAGSPQQQRLRRFDQQRVNDLEQLQSQIVNYWQSKNKLPESLSALRDDLRGITIPTDPETQTVYGYEIRGTNVFALCANFSAAEEQSSRSSPAYGVGGSSWNHPAGKYCFERKIDKDFFQQNLPVKSVPVN